ncbi:hypothetical protein D9619_011525 [Psilocybe cf. subviscida]|uniref:Uncharacterized protein n=1 Tax=Psilocybe cf. subviscida TaxID=2480587 RepID=A0A8H5BSL5_9AGAR|nr:hypothetical protein D9619_011525 [Psilocybe cf. subviscida]
MSTPSVPASPWVIVDDFDPSINYQGTWIWSIVEVSDIDQETAYNNTGHAILPTFPGGEEQSGSFSMVFEGTDIAVYGNSTIGNYTVPASSSSPINILPQWSCTVDGGNIPNGNPFSAFPYSSFCSATDLPPDTPHILNVTVIGSGVYGFSMDFVRYKPSAAALTSGTVDATAPAKPLTAGARGKTAWVGADDAGISYAPGWGDLATGKMFFAETGPSTGGPAATIGFTGSSVTWHGLSKEVVWDKMKDTTPSLAAALNGVVSGTYVLDGHGELGGAADGVDTLYPFTMNLSSPAEQIQTKGNAYNEVVFHTPQLIAGQHVLRVWLDTIDWPLTLDYLTIENGFANVDGPAGALGGTSGKSKGALIGGAVGGIIGGLLLIIFALFLIRQRTIMRRKQRSSNVIRRWANTDIKLHPVNSPTREGVVAPTQPEEFVNQSQNNYAFAFDSKNGRF